LGAHLANLGVDGLIARDPGVAPSVSVRAGKIAEAFAPTSVSRG
jgi:hypothetical protein